MVEVREVLRRWVRGEGERPAARTAGVDRKTARRYIAAGLEAGLVRNGDESQLTDELIGLVCEKVRPSRPDGHGDAWRALLAEEEAIEKLLAADLTMVKAHELLSRKGVVVPYRTFVRFCVERLGAGRTKRITVRVADPKPGCELQVDFGRMGLVPDGERRRVCHALVFTACYSRHCYVWLTFSQKTADVICGFEAAWAFFGGVFPVVIPDNMAQIVTAADKLAPRFNDTFLEYSQSRNFVIDAARVRTPTDKPRVERVVPYVRNNFFAGERFVDLADVRRRAETWCSDKAGMRVHGTTACRPAEVFRAEEAALLLERPSGTYDTPIWSEPKVHRDFHVEVARSLYSVSHTLVGKRLVARADQKTVKLYLAGELLKVHPRLAPGKRSSDPGDFPEGRETYANRDLEHLARLAREAGEATGAYAAAILDHPLPWTKMRQVYRLLGLVKKWGPARVNQACARALEAEAVDVNLVSRMLERAREAAAPEDRPETTLVSGRFARDATEFAPRARVSR